MKTNYLNNRLIERAKPTEKEYSISDGNGLYLRIKPTHKKIWLFNYMKPDSNKRTNIKLGEYPYLSINQARNKVKELKTLLAQNIDPQFYEQQKRFNTFEKLFNEWLKSKIEKGDYLQATAKRTQRIVEIYLMPLLKNTPVTNIKALSVLNHLKAIESKIKSTVTIKKAIQYLNQVMTFASNRGLITSVTTSHLNNEFKAKPTQHRPTIELEEMPRFMASINKLQAQERRLILWQLLTMTRPSETATAQYKDIDEKAKTWTVTIRKGGNERKHIIPLTNELMELLNEIKADNKGNSNYLFSDGNQHISKQRANYSIKKVFNGNMTAHSLRALASTYLNEKGENKDLIELNLSHLNNDKVRQSYNHANYYDKRRNLLTKLSNFVIKASKVTFLKIA